ncbi:MAG: hypothetical protein ABI396_11990 [Ktedonobacteraceae bacterium]
MSSESFSLLIWLWNDLPMHTTMVRVQRVDTGEYVPLQEGSFLLRVATEEDASILRCSIRHLASGREAHIQSGQTLQAFLLSTLLDSGGTAFSLSPAPDTE